MYDRYQFDEPTQSDRFFQLTKQLRCMVCQNQDLSESQAPLAMDLKNQLREQLRLGKSDQAIKAYFVERYGRVILYKPPFESFSLFGMGHTFFIISHGAFSYFSGSVSDDYCLTYYDVTGDGVCCMAFLFSFFTNTCYY